MTTLDVIHQATQLQQSVAAYAADSEKRIHEAQTRADELEQANAALRALLAQATPPPVKPPPVTPRAITARTTPGDIVFEGLAMGDTVILWPTNGPTYPKITRVADQPTMTVPCADLWTAWNQPVATTWRVSWKAGDEAAGEIDVPRPTADKPPAKLPTPGNVRLRVNPHDPLRSYVVEWDRLDGADWYRVEHRLTGDRTKVWQREVQQPEVGEIPTDLEVEQVDRPNWQFEARVQAFRSVGDGSDDSNWSVWADVRLPASPINPPIILVPPSGNSIRLAQGEDMVKAAYAARDQGKELIAEKLTFDRQFKFEEAVTRLRITECTARPPAGGLFIGHWLITIRGMTDSLIQGNTIIGGGAEAIAGYGDWSRTTVADNTHRDGFEFMHLYEYSGQGLQVLRNRCDNLRRMGIELQGNKAIARDTLVQGNVIKFTDLSRTYDGTFGLSIMHLPGIRTRVLDNLVEGPSGNRKPGSWGVAVGIEFCGEEGECAGNIVQGTNESLHVVYCPRAVVTRNQLHDAGHIAIWQTGTQPAVGCKITGNDLRTQGEVFVFDGGAAKSRDMLVEGNTIAPGYRTLRRGEFGGAWKQN